MKNNQLEKHLPQQLTTSIHSKQNQVKKKGKNIYGLKTKMGTVF